ncbi:MAG: ParB/RepB/Spo0J family partition protein [Epulopiscium sp.]|nr:ParB/RepB/Spo0J family partition protein [Candidatus Epulonipiscium sp.]
MAKKGLGKGLSALIQEQQLSTMDELSAAQWISIHEVMPNEHQPRKKFKEEGLQELAKSIEQYGILQPLIVKKVAGGYEIIAGERRWRAARMLKIDQIPVMIQNFNSQKALEISLIENIQREDLNPIEEAKAYQRLIEEFNLTQEKIAKKVSKSRSVIANSLRLLQLDPRVQEMLIEEVITSGHARALLGISDLELQYQVAQKVFDEELTVRETEKLIKKLLDPKSQKRKKQSSPLQPVYQEIEERFKQILGTKVQISQGKNKGKIEIEYYSNEDLERILSLMQSIKQ